MVVRPTQEDNVKHAFNLRAIAQEMKAAQDEVRQMAPLTSQLSGFDDAVAYDVAHLIHQERINEDAVPVGRKIGFTNPDMWSLYGVREPISKWCRKVVPGTTYGFPYRL